MLAKEMKIQNIAKQDYFIRERLAKAAKFSQNGSVSFLYIGFIYKEVRAGLEAEGICFKETGTNTSGIPTVLLYLSDCDLTLEELEESHKIFESQKSYQPVEDAKVHSLDPIDYMN